MITWLIYTQTLVIGQNGVAGKPALEIALQIHLQLPERRVVVKAKDGFVLDSLLKHNYAHVKVGDFWYILLEVSDFVYLNKF